MSPIGWILAALAVIGVLDIVLVLLLWLNAEEIPVDPEDTTGWMHDPAPAEAGEV